MYRQIYLFSKAAAAGNAAALLSEYPPDALDQSKLYNPGEWCSAEHACGILFARVHKQNLSFMWPGGIAKCTKQPINGDKNLKALALQLHREVNQLPARSTERQKLVVASEALSAEVRLSRTANGIRRAIKVWYAIWCTVQPEVHSQVPSYWRSADEEELNSDDEGALVDEVCE